MKPLVIAGKKFTSRFFLGTGKFGAKEIFAAALAASGAELVTVSLTRVDFADPDDDILSVIDQDRVTVMLNTAGARDAAEAVRVAKIGQAAGYQWIKLEVHPDARYLLPDPVETLSAAEQIVKMGLTVLPYINADPVLAKRLEDIGAPAVMPLAAPIGSNQGLRTLSMLEIIIAQSRVPVIVDAGIGLPSHAAQAIEIGADAVLVNTAVAAAGDPPQMARAFALAIQAAETALDANPPRVRAAAAATSPTRTFAIFKD
ncbi:MAG: thiazole synthase [Planctomycetota bacterium]|jgi:thiazole synthase|nr:thiazole synthase [Planctomycetota bacterium]